MSSARDPDATYKPPSGAGASLSASDTQSLVPALSIVWHADPARIGDDVVMPGLAAGAAIELSRVSPEFQGPSQAARGLADRALSRSPMALTSLADGAIELRPADGGGHALVDGVELAHALVLPLERIRGGVIIELAERVVLLLHLGARTQRESLEPASLRGRSPSIVRAREQIRAVAGVDVPVLIRGETGTGKELAARALHEAGPRRERPFVAVNMGALAATLAPSELFGHARGAFSGAVASRDGMFVRADGGTLFLDEIGEAPIEVQVMLLRALETGIIQPVGGSTNRRVDVRFIAATDASLEEAVAAGRFRAPLYHRLAGYEVFMPPLRDRPQDIGPLLAHFLADELAPFGAVGRLTAPDPAQPMWLGPSLMRHLVRFPWPGNVRQLRNVARQLAVSGHARDVAILDPALERVLGDSLARPLVEPLSASPSEPPAAPDGGAQAHYALTEEGVRDALAAHDYRLGRAAGALGVARNTLNAFIARSEALRRPRDLSAADIRAALDDAGGDPAAAARALGVSERGLKLRQRDLASDGHGE